MVSKIQLRRKFFGCKKCDEKIFYDEQEIDKPTLLIGASYKTRNIFFCILNRITLGLLGLDKILTIESPIGMKIYFENLYDQEIEGRKGVDFHINYPNSPQIRPWKLNFPNLKKKGDCCYAETKTLFKPEIPGNHELIITNVSRQLQYADYHGLTGRKFKKIDGMWRGSFYVYSMMESRILIIIIFTLIVSFIALILSLIHLV